MLAADGCLLNVLINHEGKIIERVKYGDDGWAQYPNERCGDCGAKVGHYHHDGCDIERCPVCGGQAMGGCCGYNEVGRAVPA